jgi:hypothetical protein
LIQKNLIVERLARLWVQEKPSGINVQVPSPQSRALEECVVRLLPNKQPAQFPEMNELATEGEPAKLVQRAVFLFPVLARGRQRAIRYEEYATQDHTRKEQRQSND